MNIKKVIIIFFIIVTILIVLTNTCSADMLESMKTNMSGVDTVDSSLTNKGIGKVINTIIGLLQVAGTGISLIVITMLGIKYIMASAGEKAEIKKQAIPIVVGCVLLFGAVNIMAAVEDMAQKI